MATLNIAADAPYWSRPVPLRPSFFRKCALALSLLLLFPVHLSQAQELRPTEAQLEAAYLYNFGKFVTWPPDRTKASETFGICILGKDPFGQVLDATVTGESIGGRKIEVKRLANMAQAQACNILFVSMSEEGRLGPILAAAEILRLLTVSDIKHFAERGGAIGLVRQQDKIRFEINRRAADRCHLVFSSELLKVASKLFPEGAPGS